MGATAPSTDWEYAPVAKSLLGREDESRTLEAWASEQVHVGAVVGLGGTGKTHLVAHQCRLWSQRSSEEGSFQHIVWRTLLNAPPPDQLVDDLLSTLSGHRETRSAQDLHGKLVRR